MHTSPRRRALKIVVTVGGDLPERFEVQHTTVYRYRRAVTFGPHQADAAAARRARSATLATELEISPASTAKWVYDVLGNSVTIVTLLEPASELRFASRLTIERFGSRPPRGEVEPSAVRYPFVYSMQDRFDLGRMLEQRLSGPGGPRG